MSGFGLLVGSKAALDAFGIKQAGAWRDYLHAVKRQAIGDPSKTWKQIRGGTLFKPGKGLLHNALPRSAGQLAATLAWPVMGSYLLAKNNPYQGGGALAGDFVGRSVGSVFGAPLAGAAGSIGGGMLLSPVGRAVGSLFDYKESSPVVPEQ